LFVGADPEPDDHILLFTKSEDAIVPADPSGENETFRVSALKVKAGVTRVG
jgi:hypothetical protein